MMNLHTSSCEEMYVLGARVIKKRILFNIMVIILTFEGIFKE